MLRKKNAKKVESKNPRVGVSRGNSINAEANSNTEDANRNDGLSVVNEDRLSVAPSVLADDKVDKPKTFSRVKLVEDIKQIVRAKDPSERFQGLELLKKHSSLKDAVVSLVAWINQSVQGKVFDPALRAQLAPFCIFMGMQSVGKSTTINLILKQNILLVKEGTGTRCPTQVLIDPSMDSTFRFNDQVVKNISLLHKAVEEHMKVIEDTASMGLTDKPASIIIPSPDAALEESNKLALVVWDTPGITVNKSARYDSAVEELSKKIVEEYGTQESSWLFFVERFAALKELENRKGSQIINKAKHKAVVITHIREGLHKDFCDKLVNPSAKGVEDYVREKLREKGMEVEHIFFAMIPDTIDPKGELYNMKNFDSEIALKQHFENLLGPQQSFKLKGIESLRVFISNEMMRQAKSLLDCVKAAIDTEKVVVDEHLEFLQKQIQDTKYRRTIRQKIFRTAVIVTHALVVGDTHGYRGSELEKLDLAAEIDREFSRDAPMNFDPVTSFTPTSGNFLFQIMQMLDELKAYILELKFTPLSTEEIFANPSADASGQFSTRNTLVKELTRFLCEEVRLDVEERLKNWFEEAISRLVESAMKVIMKVPEYSVSLRADGGDFQSIMTSYFEERLLNFFLAPEKYKRVWEAMRLYSKDPVLARRISLLIPAFYPTHGEETLEGNEEMPQKTVQRKPRKPAGSSSGQEKLVPNRSQGPSFVMMPRDLANILAISHKKEEQARRWNSFVDHLAHFGLFKLVSDLITIISEGTYDLTALKEDSNLEDDFVERMHSSVDADEDIFALDNQELTKAKLTKQLEDAEAYKSQINVASMNLRNIKKLLTDTVADV